MGAGWRREARREEPGFLVFRGDRMAVDHCLFSSKPWESQREEQTLPYTESLSKPSEIFTLPYIPNFVGI